MNDAGYLSIKRAFAKAYNPDKRYRITWILET
jgi:hypothetical protein